MLQKVIISIYEFPEPTRTFTTSDGRIGLVFEPSKFYILSARYDLGEALDIEEKPMIHDVSLGEYMMYFCEISLIEGVFCIFVSVGFGNVAVDLTNCIEMDLEKEFRVDYDIIEQTTDSGTPEHI